MTEEKRETLTEEQLRAEAEQDFKNAFFEALKSASHKVSIDEDGFIVIPVKRHRRSKEKNAGERQLNHKFIKNQITIRYNS